MPAFGLMPVSCRAIGLVVLLAVLAVGSAALAWQLQDWRYGRQLAEQARMHASPAPAAWIMAPYAPDLTRRMRNELSPSPTPGTVD